jgi:Phage head-tail joining protein
MDVSKDFNLADMRFLGTLQKNVPISDNSGGQTDNWVNVLTTRVKLEKRSGRLINGAGQVEYYKEYILTCRSQVAFVQSTDLQWNINNEKYDVKDFDKVDLIPHLYTFTITKQNGL